MVEMNALELLAMGTMFLSTTKVRFLRTLRRYALPIAGVSLIGYRLLVTPTDTSSNILLELIKFVESISNRITFGEDASKGKAIARFVKDAIGLFICSSMFNVLLVPSSSGLADISFKSKDIMEYLYSIVKDLPMVQKEVAKEAAKLEAELEVDLKTKARAIGTSMATLPMKGMLARDILQLMKVETAKENVVWQKGRVSGAVYHGNADHQDLLNQAFGLYSIANPLHPDIWPSGMKFEAEIIAMTASLVKGGLDTVCGCTTSGGTESIILAIKSHRDFYKAKYGITCPELVCCVSAHAAVDKACDLMNIRLIKVPMDTSYRCDVAAVRSAIGPNTIMIYASAPSYPQGTIDDIEKLSELASRHSIGLHVDCCLGGFVLPFMVKLGYPVPSFDFSLPGVTSMSLDTHKFGFALKGASVVLYRTKALRQSQYFCYADWTGGMYTTPTIAGSRSGGLIAQCWASLVAMGEEGYMKHCRDIIETTKAIATGVKLIDGLVLLGAAEAMIVCFAAAPATAAEKDAKKSVLNIYSVADEMSKKGWSLNSLQNPSCVHLCITVRHVGQESQFLDDLKDSVAKVKAAMAAGAKVDGKAAIYGMTSGLPSGPVNSLLRAYNDVVLKL